MKTVLLCLRPGDRREQLLREVRWLSGAELAPVSLHLQGTESAAELRESIARVSPALVAITNDRFPLLGVVPGLLRRSPAPVYVVPLPGPGRSVEPRPTRILVPLDGTDRAATVLPFVEDLALEHGAEVVLARVEREGLDRPLLAHLQSTARIEATLEPWRERLAGRGIGATAVAAHGRPAPRIVALAERLHADVIAMTARDRTGLARWLDCSTSRGVLRRAALPLLIQPAPG